MKHLWNEQEKMDGMKTFFMKIKEDFLILKYSMTVSEFKRIYTEIDPNANLFNFDANAERMFLEYFLRFF
jgi:hypothetical protein